jgi:phosphotransferase system enzyme I (PtsI)
LQAGARAGLPVSVCGEMAGDPKLTRLLLGMGLRQFSMHSAQLLEVKQQILKADIALLVPHVARLLKADEPEKIAELMARL